MPILATASQRSKPSAYLPRTTRQGKGSTDIRQERKTSAPPSPLFAENTKDSTTVLLGRKHSYLSVVGYRNQYPLPAAFLCTQHGRDCFLFVSQERERERRKRIKTRRKRNSQLGDTTWVGGREGGEGPKAHTVDKSSARLHFDLHCSTIERGQDLENTCVPENRCPWGKETTVGRSFH